MEDTLRAFDGRNINDIYNLVLILVVMEDTLRALQIFLSEKSKIVLILVLMEDTLRKQDIRILCISGISIYKTITPAHANRI